jgi:hypothetical protein
VGRLVGRSCTICRHGEHHAINVALVSREPYRDIARHYDVSKDALKRHSEEHIPQLLVQARDAVEVAEADDLLAELRDEKADIQRLKGLAEADQDYRTALLAVDKALRALELQAKVAKLIDTAPKVNNMVLISPEIQEAIIKALMPYPEARLSVDNALEELEAVYEREDQGA